MSKKIIYILFIAILVAMCIVIINIFRWHIENQSNQSIINSLYENNVITSGEAENIYIKEIVESIEQSASIPSGENTTITSGEQNIPPRQSEDISKKLKEATVSYKLANNYTNITAYIIDYDYLQNLNPSTVGWIKVSNTKVDYPIVQSNDNKFYLNHNFLKQYNSAGWIFADYKNNFLNLNKNTVLYGHNRRNDSMFGSLEKTFNKNWLENSNNKYIFFSTEQQSYIAEIFSIYKTSANELVIPIEFKDNSSFLDYIKDIKEKSIHDFNISIAKSDKILTLYTCDSNNEYRILVHAKLINT